MLNDTPAIPSEGYGSEGDVAPDGKAQTPTVTTLKQIKAWHRQAVNLEAQWRDRSEEDSRFLSGDHWTDEEKKVLRDRKQAAIVFNRIARDVYIQVGRQIQQRQQPTVKPRGAGDVATASAMTDLLRYVMDANGWSYEMTAAVVDQVAGPRGWLSVQYQNTDLTKEPIEIRHVPWREIRLDPQSRRLDLADAKYLFRERWVDLEDARARYPQKAEQLQKWVNTGLDEGGMGPKREYYTGDAYTNAKENGDGPAVNYVSQDRKRVQLVECWFRKAVETWAVKFPDGHVQVLDDGNAEAAYQPGAQLVRGLHDCIYYVIFCGDVVLAQGKSPYTHGQYPYVCLHAYRAWIAKGTDTLVPGEPYSMVRNAKDPQRVINSTQSKVRHILNTRNIVMAKGVADRDEVEQAASDPAGIIELLQDGRFEFVDQLSQLSGLMGLLPIAEDQLQAGSGINEASRGSGPEASGRALFARQQQSMTTNMTLVDNQALAIRTVGQMVVSMIQQSYTDEKIVRITEEMGDRMVAINVKDPSRALQLANNGIETAGDISQDVYDVIVDTAPAGEERLDADQQLLMQVSQALGPQGTLLVADLLVENTDLRNKRELMERLSTIQQQAFGGGQGPSPEQQAMMQQQMAGTQAKVQKEQAQAAKAQADATKAGIEAQRMAFVPMAPDVDGDMM